MAGKGIYYESQFEEATIELLREAHWQYTFGDDIHRKYTDPLIEEDLRNFLAAQYKDRDLTTSEIDGIVANLRNTGGQNDYYALRNAFLLYRDGYDFAYSDGRDNPFRLEYIDFEHPDHNIFRCVNQFVMEQGRENRRPDILLFVNGIPVCIIELKNPTKQNATIRDAHTQICTRYMRDIPALLKYCALAVISDGAKNALGTIYTPFEFFYEWKKIENEDKAGKGLDTLRTLIRGALSPERILEILRDYVYFPDPTKEDDTTEIVCRYPQFFATRKLRDHILNHLRSVGGDGKGGTYFGATGCGKTYTMLFLARQLVLRCKKQLGSPTILIIVDREDLETQSGKLFCRSKQYLEDEAVKVFETRKELAEEMSTRKTGGVYITTIQKFAETTGLLTERSNVICLSDEAHRSQSNIGSKLSIQTEGEADKIGAKITYGFAKYLRDALPNATYIGFTGTPISQKDRSTREVFGDYIDVYDMTQSVEDGATRPVFYESRVINLKLDEQSLRRIDAEYDAMAEEAEEYVIEKSKRELGRLDSILGADATVASLCEDIVKHYEEFRQYEQTGKAMIVAYSRPIAIKIYRRILEMRPVWSDKLAVVMTSGNKDPEDWRAIIGNDSHKKELEKRFKDNDSSLKIVIVVDMWLTGFDVPSLSTMYVYKPMSGHNLMQAIARVNRVFGDKQGGLVVDYVGIASALKTAMNDYT